MANFMLSDFKTETYYSYPTMGKANEIVQTLLDTYLQSSRRLNMERIDKQENFRELISLEILDQLRQEAVARSAQGARAYFGRYPDDYADFLLAGRQSLVFTVEVLKFSPNRFVVPADITAWGPDLQIERDMVNSLLTTYRQTSHKINSERIGKQDSLSVLLSVELLNQICEEATVKKLGGIYAYFSRYPDTYHEIAKAGRQSLILTVSDLKSSPDGFVVPGDMVAFFDMPFCPPVCNCGGPGLPPC